jgi:REP element-mobilizing transposase RayT
MADTFTNLLVHVIFSTKHRAALLEEPLRGRLYEYVGGTLRKEGDILLEIGGMPDHVHLLVRLKADHSVSTMARTIKASSSKWVHQTFPDRQNFAWQTGYGAFSVSESQAATVRRYIQGQAEHHARLSFKDELIALLRRHRITFEERYLLD